MAQQKKSTTVKSKSIQNKKLVSSQPTQSGTSFNKTIKISYKPSQTRIIILAVILIIVALLFYFKGLFIAAVVNGQPISRFEVISRLEKEGGKQILNSIVIQNLIMQEANKRHISVSQDEMNKQISSIEKNLASQGQTLTQALTSQGMSQEDFQTQVREQLLVNKMVGKIQVSNSEVDSYIAANKSQIPQGENDATIRAQAVQQLTQQKQQTLTQQFVQKLQSNAHISYFVSY